MLKFKKNPGKIKEKVVFKFQFHVTRVPQAGWDKLKVSLIPQDSGRRSNKTGKGSVEYGCCRWPDPIVESTKLSQDSQSGRFDDKFYKIVVGARSRILGDVTINLADFANAASNSVALPLQNCPGNTLLHAKIYSLTTLRKSRETSVQDEQSSDSEEEELDNISVASSTSQALSGPHNKSVSSPRDTMSVSRYSTDTVMEPMTPKETNGSMKDFYTAGPPSPTSSVNGGYERRRRRFGSQGSFPSVPEPQLARASSSGMQLESQTPRRMQLESETPRRMQLESETPRRMQLEKETPRRMQLGNETPRLMQLENETPRHMRSLSFRSNSPLERDTSLTPDKSVQELRMEAVTWQRRARTMNLEIQKLKQELELRQRGGGDPSLDKLKSELQAAKRDRDDSEQKLRKEIDDLQRALRDLKKEAAYEKEANANINLQLRQAQDSNMQLVLAIQDMEESLEEQRREMEELSSTNHKLEVSAYESKNLEKQLASKEETIKVLQERLNNADKVEAAANKSSDKFEDIERELKELTDENMELIFQLNKATKELDKKNDKKVLVVAQEIDGSVDPEEVERLKSMIVELEKKLAATEEFHQLQHSSNEKLMVRLQTLIHGLKSANADLENQLRSLDYDIQNLSNKLETEKAALEEAKDRNVAAIQEEERLNKLVDDLNSRNRELGSQIATLVNGAQKHEVQMEDLMREFEVKLVNIKELKDRLLQLEMLNSGLEMKIQDSQELHKLSKQRIAELESQSSTLAEALEEANGCRQELESKVETLDSEMEEALSMLKVEQDCSRAEIHGLEQQIATAKVDIDHYMSVKATLENTVSSLGKSREDLEAQLSRSKTEAVELRELVARVEAEARFLESELEASKRQQVAAQNQVVESEKQKAVLAGAMNEYKSKWLEVDAQCDEHAIAVRQLEAQLEVMKAELAEHLTANEVLVIHAEKLEETAAMIKEENRESIQKLEAQVAGLERKNTEAVHREFGLLAELNSVKEAVEVCKTQIIAAEREAFEQSKRSTMLQSQMEERENKYSDLEVKVILLEAERNSFKLAQEDLKMQAEVLKGHVQEKSALVNGLRDKLVELENEGDVVKQDRQRLQIHVEALKDEVTKQHCSEKILREKVQLLENEGNCLKQDRVNLEARMEDLKEMIARHHLSEEILQRRVDEGEESLAAMMRDLKDCDLLKAAAEDQLAIFSDDNTKLGAALAERKAACVDLERKLESESSVHQQAREDLEVEVSSLHGQVDDLRSSKAALENRITELEDNNRRLEKLKEDSASAMNVLEVQVAELKSTISTKDHQSLQDKELLLQSLNEQKHNALETERQLQHKLEELSLKLDATTEECLRVSAEKSLSEEKLKKAERETAELESCRAQEERKLKEAQCKIEQSVEKLLKITNQIEDDMMHLLTSSNTECASKLAKFEEEVIVLKEKLQKNGEPSKLESVEDEKLRAEHRFAELSERLAFIQARLQDLRSKLDEEQEADTKEKVSVEEATREKQDVFEMEALIREHESKAAALQNQIDYLETTIERQMDAGLEQFQVEVTRLQKQLALCAQRERELLSKLSTQEILEKEIRRLQQDNEQLIDAIGRLKAASEWDDAHARIVVLETELAEALETKTQHSSSETTELLNGLNSDFDLKRYKRPSLEVEQELKDMQDRYSGLSLQFAEVVAEKEQLSFALRNLERSSEILLRKRRSF